eukprot:CAMPEP_0168609346 /NCGR_PEP_ID=MMETSP0449_2-20121227/1150_1 /TAXON_ID=1082188 /ORGANISM="Strombidium rassoulzadegani, Strain ras09" /LENGTH=115 /DNA_ID=CAMNT_0008649469 /DNA_START=278 /DNA_END=625 /DNA_ORIENTATION=+
MLNHFKLAETVDVDLASNRLFTLGCTLNRAGGEVSMERDEEDQCTEYEFLGVQSQMTHVCSSNLLGIRGFKRLLKSKNRGDLHNICFPVDDLNDSHLTSQLIFDQISKQAAEQCK